MASLKIHYFIWFESFSTWTDNDSGCDGFDGSVNNMSGRQLLAVAEATVMQQPGINDVIAVTASESSTRTIDTDGEQDSQLYR